MKTRVARFGAVTLAVLMALTPTPSAAIAPVLLMMVREIAQQVATSMIKDTLLSGLSGMGCKGIALSKALTAFDLRGGISMPTLPAGMSLLKPMIPQLRQAREELYALSPADQDEVAAMLVQQMKALPAAERAALMEHLGSGFFPPRVDEVVRAGWRLGRAGACADPRDLVSLI